MRELPVILDVNPDSVAIDQERDFLEKIGHPILACRGPDADQVGCPILRGERCALLEQADGVIFQLDLDDPRHRRLLVKYIEYFDQLEVPVRVVVTPEQKQRYAKLLRLVEVWTPPVNVGKLDGFSSEVDYGWEQAPKPRPASGG
jgi:hypothetical protein